MHSRKNDLYTRHRDKVDGRLWHGEYEPPVRRLVLDELSPKFNSIDRMYMFMFDCFHQDFWHR